MFDISVIIPALSANNEYFRCLYSIRAAFSGRLNFEIICVVREVNAFNGIENFDLHIIQEEKPGIYGAMNTGLSKATGDYVYFIGQDDVLLPSAANALLLGLASKADIIVCDVFWGKTDIFKNRASRKTLLWKNWCHQGIFYNRLKFLEVIGKYPEQFKIQADHYINILIGSTPGLNLVKFNGCIAWYSSDGYSSRFDDLEFRDAFPAIVHKHFGFIPFCIVVFRRAVKKQFMRILKTQ